MSDEPKPLLVTGPVARRMIGVGNTKYWDLVKKVLIEVVSLDGRKMATYASLERLAKPTDGVRTAA